MFLLKKAPGTDHPRWNPSRSAFSGGLRLESFFGVGVCSNDVTSLLGPNPWTKWLLSLHKIEAREQHGLGIQHGPNEASAQPVDSATARSCRRPSPVPVEWGQNNRKRKRGTWEQDVFHSWETWLDTCSNSIVYYLPRWMVWLGRDSLGSETCKC